MINTKIRYKADNMKLDYLYFLSSSRLSDDWLRHVTVISSTVISVVTIISLTH